MTLLLKRDTINYFFEKSVLEKEGKKMKSSAAGGCTVEKEDRYLLLDTENQDGGFMENIICEMSEKKEFLRINGWR